MTAASGIRSRKEGSIGWIVFDNPERLNAVSSEMLAEGVEVLKDLESDPEVKVIVMRGTGEKAFVSGGDISKFEKTRFSGAVQMRKYGDEFNTGLENSAKPVIAMIHGFCLGGGMGIALCADLRFAADNCQLGIPSAQRGVAYGAESVARLMDVVGSSAAKDILMSARRIRQEEALRLGLVNRVFKPEDLERETVAYAEIVARNAPLSVRAAKFFVNQLKLEKAGRNGAEMQRMQAAAAASEDFKEATRAFMEKRKAVFRGV